MIAPALRGYVEDLEDAMLTARALGLYRTAERVHQALNEARAEVFEVIPPVTVEFTIGPVREQP